MTYDRLLIHCRFRKMTSVMTSLKISSVVSSAYTAVISQRNTPAARRHSGIPIHQVPIVSISMIV